MKKRVVVAMSGGVDSSVAAALLKQQGFEVIGLTMCFGTEVGAALKNKRPTCCGQEAISDARKVAEVLGIKHYVLNFSKDLEQFVIKDFLNEYSQGRTPNPCVRCNQFIKFGTLLAKARSLDAQFLATGHYARIEFNPKTNHYLLKKGKDTIKDQSYFLYAIDRESLPFILFPLGGLTKLEVRKLAKSFKLPVQEKPASQEICFVPDADYRGFLERGLKRINKKMEPGPILDTQGNVLGEHRGIGFYTIGQRQGLALSAREPLYVIKIDSQKNAIRVGTKGETYCTGLIASKLKFLYPPKKRRLDLKVKIRYNQQEFLVRLFLSDNSSARVQFKQSQPSVTPGQAVVFYEQDSVLGGGTIDKGVFKRCPN